MDINRCIRALGKAIDQDALYPPEMRESNCTTLLTQDSHALLVHGSADEMKPLFGALLDSRPEFRGMLQDTLDEHYKKADW